jgi:hypothetical protein
MVLLGMLLSLSAAAWPVLNTKTITEKSPDDTAVVVGIARPFALPVIAGAVDNANDWYFYFTQSRGLLPDRVTLLRDGGATKEDIDAALQAAIAKVGPQGTVWFVFIGHGAPSASGGDGMLLGADTQPTERSVEARGLSRSVVMERLAQAPHAVMVLDACFSGQSHDGAVPLVKGAMATIPLKRVAPRHTVGVFSSSDQVAGPLPGMARPAFSYLLLGALRGWGDDNNDKVVTAIEAQRYTDGVLVAMVRDRDQRANYLGGDVPLSRGAKERGPDIASLQVGEAPASKARQPLGIQVNGEQDAIRVLQVTADSPAALAGLSAGDRIVQLNGQPATLPVLGGAVKADRVRITWEHAGTRYDVYVSLVGDAPTTASAPVVMAAPNTRSSAPVAVPVVVAPVVAAPAPAPTQSAGSRCLGGDVTACRVAIDEATGDPKQQLKLTMHSCQIGDNQVCITAGAMLIDKGAVKEGVPLLEVACHRDRETCLLLAATLITKSIDPQRGVKILEDNCRAGSAGNCGGLGAVLMEGAPGVSQNTDRGMQLLTQACDARHAWSCGQLGNNLSVLQQHHEARRAYRQACQLGLTEVCEQD